MIKAPILRPKLKDCFKYFACIACVRHFTLDGYEVIEPMDYWLTEEIIAWINKHYGCAAPKFNQYLGERAWRKWFNTEWLDLHPSESEDYT
jgi:hypothetical protein